MQSAILSATKVSNYYHKINKIRNLIIFIVISNCYPHIIKYATPCNKKFIKVYLTNIVTIDQTNVFKLNEIAKMEINWKNLWFLAVHCTLGVLENHPCTRYDRIALFLAQNWAIYFNKNGSNSKKCSRVGLKFCQILKKPSKLNLYLCNFAKSGYTASWTKYLNVVSVGGNHAHR